MCAAGRTECFPFRSVGGLGEDKQHLISAVSQLGCGARTEERFTIRSMTHWSFPYLTNPLFCLQECSKSEAGDDGDIIFNVIGGFEVPRFTYSEDRNKYLADADFGKAGPKLYAGKDAIWGKSINSGPSLPPPPRVSLRGCCVNRSVGRPEKEEVGVLDKRPLTVASISAEVENSTRNRFPCVNIGHPRSQSEGSASVRTCCTFSDYVSERTGERTNGRRTGFSSCVKRRSLISVHSHSDIAVLALADSSPAGSIDLST